MRKREQSLPSSICSSSGSAAQTSSSLYEVLADEFLAITEVADSGSDTDDDHLHNPRLTRRLSRPGSSGKAVLEAASSSRVEENGTGRHVTGLAGSSNTLVPDIPNVFQASAVSMEGEILREVPESLRHQRTGLSTEENSNAGMPDEFAEIQAEAPSMPAVLPIPENPSRRQESSGGFASAVVVVDDDEPMRNVNIEEIILQASQGNARALQSNAALDLTVEESAVEADVGCGSNQNKDKNAKKGNAHAASQQVAATDADALSCPICMEPCYSVGSHRISCLPCGHLFGRSCIRTWIQQSAHNIGKCPHCNRKSKLNEIRTLYVPRIAVADGEMQQELISLRAENERLKLQNKILEINQTKEVTLMMEIEQLRLQNEKLREENCGHKALLAALHPGKFGSSSGFHRRQYGIIDEYEPLVKKRHVTPSNEFMPVAKQSLLHFASGPGIGRASPIGFVLKDELQLQGARVFDMNAFSQIILVSQKASDLGSVHFLTKMSFLVLSEGECIKLPDGTGAVRDLCITPAGRSDAGKLALVASLGKKLSVVSLESNNVVLTYDLPSPAWSCAWDLYDPHRFYAGLQNGMLLIFDSRICTTAPLNFIKGLSSQPIHALHTVAESECHNGRGVLSASGAGPSFWNVSDSVCRPYSVSGLENQGVCISLAYCGIADVAVASYRPKAVLPVASSPCSSLCKEGVICSQSISPEGYAETLSSCSRSPRMGSHYVLTKEPRDIHIGDRMVYPAISSSENSDNLGGKWSCNHEKFMLGNVSSAGMQKSAIVTLERSGRGAECKESLFAYGDELSRAVSIWDMQSLSVTECLKPHQYPILGVKHVHIAGQDLLGCASEKMLQIYAYSK